eukprot:GHVO01039925.1.p1 GENE.GHVO01039925.1~~GHVO01039925.1.p1  ORF type:complete len:404 (+),score=52.84 GHVO01039925.1:26-1237(+)
MSFFGHLIVGAVGVASQYTTFQFPALRNCPHSPRYVYDADGLNCVYGPRKASGGLMPFFEPCPNGTQLVGRYCVGPVYSEREKTCKMNYSPNLNGMCIKTIVYEPQQVPICPEGFALDTMVGQDNLDLCMRKVLTPPIVKCDGQHDNDTLEMCPNSNMLGSGQSEPHLPLTFECPSGGRLRKSSKGIIQCIVETFVTPTYAKTCQKGYQYRPDFRGGVCMGLIVEAPSLACPKPSYQLGPSRGDLETPVYKWDRDRGVCVANMILADVKGCPTGYALTGKIGEHWCTRNYVEAYEFGCENAEGFMMANATTGICGIRYEGKFVGGPNHQTKRATISGKRIRYKQTPDEVADAYGNYIEAKQKFRARQGLGSPSLDFDAMRETGTGDGKFTRPGFVSDLELDSS